MIAVTCILWAATASCADELVPVRPDEQQGQQDPNSILKLITATKQEVTAEQLPIPTRKPLSVPQDKFRQQDELGQPTLAFPQETMEQIPMSVEDAEEDSRLETIKQRYPDGKVQILRHVNQDADGNFVNQGSWKWKSRSGRILADGNYEDGLMDGLWRRLHPADSPGIFREAIFRQARGPFLSVATYKKGKLHGTWTIFTAQRIKLFEMQYEEGQRHGTATWWSPNGGVTRVVHFEKGLIDGEIIEYDQYQRPKKVAEYKKGQRVYSKVTWHRKDRKETEEWYLGPKLVLEHEDNWWDAQPADYVSTGQEYREGPSRAWFDNGQLQAEGFFKDGMRDGTFQLWHANGQKRLVAHFNEDREVAVWRWWHPNGIKSIEGKYQDGLPAGEWVWWNQKGSVERRGDIDQLLADGKLDKPNRSSRPRYQESFDGFDNGFDNPEEIEVLNTDGLELQNTFEPGSEDFEEIFPQLEGSR